MDNFRLDMTAEGADRFTAALNLFNPPGNHVVGYRIDEVEHRPRIILYWTPSTKATQLPFPMTLDEAATFVLGWLKHANYGKKPDLDGDAEACGWRLYNEAWGHVNNEWEAFAAIEPRWALYGK